MGRRFCNSCGVRLSRENAYRDPKNRKKLRGTCIDCVRLQHSAIHVANAERAGIRGLTNENDLYVYFIKSDNGLIKIGRTENISKRLSSLRTASPVGLSLIAYQIGPARLEQRLHKQFKQLHSHGEWYTDDAQIRQYIQCFATSVAGCF